MTYEIGQFIQKSNGDHQFVGVADVVTGSFEEAWAATQNKNRALAHLKWDKFGWFECPVGHSFFMYAEEGCLE